MTESNVEFQEEIVQKLTYGVDQIFTEEGMEDDEVEGNEEVEYFELVPVPDQMPDLVEVSSPYPIEEKSSNNNNIFFCCQKIKMMELILLFSDFFGRL